MNGATLELGILLGELRTEGRRQTEILVAMLKEQRDLPERLAEHLPHFHHAPPHNEPPPPAPAAPPAAGPSTISQWADLIKALWPLALVAGVIGGKISAPDAVPLIRHLLGLAP